jgi:hypothetical protein
MPHWRQQVIPIILIITATTNMLLLRIKLLHLQRKCIMPLSNSSVRIKGLQLCGNGNCQVCRTDLLTIPCVPTHIGNNTRPSLCNLHSCHTNCLQRLPSTQDLPTSRLPRQRNGKHQSTQVLQGSPHAIHTVSILTAILQHWLQNKQHKGL